MPATKALPQVAVKPLSKPVVGNNNYHAFDPRTEVLPQGWNGYNSLALPCAIKVTHDHKVLVRDGCRLYCDIYRPVDSDDKPVPAIICWGPFGKKYSGLTFLPHIPWKIGVPDGTLSGLERFEGPDPAVLVPRGYAIVNVDARGVGNSDGDVVIMGTQEGEDGYDVIESIAKEPWCTGNVGMSGNSHLAIVQWHIASQQPPSLKAIAPWEACADLYREQFVRGGAFDSGLFDFISTHIIRGNGGVEDFFEMYRRSQTQNVYWADKRVDFSRIKVPAFITCSYTNFVHTMGSIRGFMQIEHDNKWFKINPYQEWYDLWAEKESMDELTAFFDKFLKGQDNGFEKDTPKVRTTVLRFGDNDPIYNIEEKEYPLARTEYRKFYLHQAKDGGQLQENPINGSVNVASYDSTSSKDFSGFTFTFDKTTRLVGLPKAVLYMSCEDADDMVVYVTLRKLDKNGKPLLALNIPWSRCPVKDLDDIPSKDMSNLNLAVGFMGVLRASHREVDESKSMHPQYPFHPHERVQPIPAGEIVKLEIGIWAMGVQFEAGESIRVQISGGYPLLKEQDFDDKKFGVEGVTQNTGTHKVHMGGEYDSHVVLPFV
ncbi:hypothetical protein QFC24_004885 [Naganishia onofrii]|uniref:Uncharacterized protein n=1 Tax=Naganishia onofrii TaxID=1851511 RepID=A0ACC2XB05_9TREE|nr:hypothetical protein QFC24_004885 [Naganishia onofrii]